MPNRQQLFEALREAIWATTPAEGWEPEDTHLRFDLVQGCIKRWADDIERTVKKAQEALDRAAAEQGTELGADQLELALMYAVAAREKLVALLTQFLGVPSLDRYKEGVRFFPRESRVRKELMTRAKAGATEAGGLMQALIAFDKLPAIGLRNQLEHGISFLPTVTEICWIRVVDLGFITGEPVGGEMSHLMAEGILDQPDITTETLFAWAEKNGQEAVAALDDLIELTTQLVASIGELVPVNEVYRIPGRKGVFTTIPAPTS
jgi:hypothetical protein